MLIVKKYFFISLHKIKTQKNMKHIKLLTVLTAIAVMIAGCDLKKMAKKHSTVQYKAEPEVLEVHGGNVAVKVKGNFPAKYFGKKVTVEFQPVLKYEGKTLTLKAVQIVGEKVNQGQGTIIKKKEGGSFEFTDQFVYDPQMFVSELWVTPVAKKGKKSVTLGEVKLADGIIATSQRVAKDEEVQIAPHGYEKVTLVSKSANLYFDYNSARLYDGQKLNKLQANRDAINALLKFIEQGWEIKDIVINAWASPEGELSLNAKLSEDRGKAAEKWVRDYFENQARALAKQRRVPVDQVRRQFNLLVNAKGEDYDGFMSALQASNLREKQAIANVIKMQDNKAAREREIKNMAVIYAEVEAILEPLRRSEIIVTCYEPKRTDEEIAQLAITDPRQLNEKELLYAATLTDNLETKLKIYQSATQIFPESWKGYNNAGAILLMMERTDEAATYIEKANALSPNNGIVLNNLGVVASQRKDMRSALKYFEQASQAGVNTNYNIGIQKIRSGEYEEALRLFSGYTCKYNVALAQVLAGKAADAAKNLECMKVKNADVYYLMAIIGARTQNTSMMYDNLKKACAENPKYKEEATKDREFLKYHQTAEFQNAVK